MNRLITRTIAQLKEVIGSLESYDDRVSDDPVWYQKALSYLGQKEIHGRRHNPLILRWWTLIRAPFTDDETPWCAGFVGGVLEECGIVSSRRANARSYMKWGTALSSPAVGCIVVFWRGKPKGWKGHVGFVAGKTDTGKLLVLGGNQGDMVSIIDKPSSRVLGYRWPKSHPLPTNFDLPVGVTKSTGRSEV